MTRAAARGLVILLCCGLAKAADLPGRGQRLWKEQPQKSALATGIPLIYHQDRASPMTVIGLFAAGGRSAVPPGLDGLAYLATRMTLEIPDEGKVQDLMAQATRMSLTCSEDCSIVLIECLSENLEEALRVAAGVIQNPLMSGLRIGRAKEMMRLYARAEEDDAVLAGRNAALRSFFQGKGYGSATYGSDDSRRAIERKDAITFFRRFFNSRSVFFCVVTNLDWAPVRALLEGHFSRFPDGERLDIPATFPALPADREVVLIKDAKQTYVGRAYALPAPTTADQAKGHLLEILLGKGPGSRLWNSLRSTGGLAYNVDAHVTWTKGAGIIEAFLETENAKAARAAQALDRTLAELWTNGVSERELEATKALAKTGFLRAIETKSERVRLLGLFEVLGLGYDRIWGISEAIDAVTLEALNTFVREVLTPERALNVTVGPAAAGKK